MINAYLYILKCKDNSYYVGSTTNIEKRLLEHQEGRGANYTRKRLPVELIFLERFTSIEEAYLREMQIHKWSRRKKEALMKGNFETLHEFSKCLNPSTALRDRES